MNDNFSNIDEYIADFPADIQEILQKVRTTIKNAAPESKEVISYRMPAFKLHSVLVYFAANKNHLGFYPTGEGVAQFQNEITAYKSSKGAIQFPFDEAIPYELIAKITKFRVESDNMKAAMKKKK